MVVINATPMQLLIWLAILVVPTLLLLGIQHIRKHRRTDPICQRSMFYRWIGNRLGYWWCSRNRGRSCPTCAAERRKASTGRGPCRHTPGCILSEYHEDYTTCLVLK